MSGDWRCPKCDTTHDPEDIKAMVSMDDVLELLDVELPTNRKIASLSNPGERTPSLHIYEAAGGWWDFGAGEGGDVIDFVQRYANVSFNRACALLAHGALSAGREPGDVAQKPVKELVDFTERLSMLSKHPALVPPAGAPWPPNVRESPTFDVLIPHERDGQAYGVKVRHMDGRKTAWPGSQFSHSLYDPFGWRGVGHHNQCVIAEGESDCWALDGALSPVIDVFALPSGCSTWRQEWQNDLVGYDEIWLCLDNDVAGKRARDKIELKLIQAGLNVRHLIVPPMFNDAREAIVGGWQPTLN